LSGQNINLDFQILYIGAMGTERPPTSLTSPSTNKDIPNFVGHMQHFIFNGQHFFDMAGSGQMTNFKVRKSDFMHVRFVNIYFNSSSFVRTDSVSAYKYNNQCLKLHQE
ncbi:hypothetical protein AVEN_61493-1, partial [Araneus ventricosus]